MKNFVDGIKKGVGLGAGFFITIFFCGIVYAGYVAITDVTPNTKLTSATFNQVLANIRDLDTRLTSKKGLDSAVVLNCYYQNDNAGAAGWKNNTWTSSNCGGSSIPSNFTNCISSIKRIDGGGVYRGLSRCNIADGWIFMDNANSQVAIECSYLCWN